MNIEDCIKYLNIYNWNLEVQPNTYFHREREKSSIIFFSFKEIVADFYSGKGLKKNNNTDPTNANREVQRNGFTPNSVTTFNKPNPQPRANAMDDSYVAELLQRYGDADEAARKQSRQTYPTQQFHEQPQEHFGNEVSLLAVHMHFENE